MKLKTFGVIGILAAAAAVFADLALQYTPVAAHLGSREYVFLLDVSRRNLLLGHYLGVVAVLGEICGFWFVAQGLKPAGRRPSSIFFAIGAVAFGVGAAFHAMFAPIGLALRSAADAGLSPAFAAKMAAAVRPAHEGLGTITLLGILLLSLLFSFLVALRTTAFPRWMALCSPLPVVLLFGALTRLMPSLRLVFFPAGLNIANFVLFMLAFASYREGAAGSVAEGDVRG